MTDASPPTSDRLTPYEHPLDVAPPDIDELGHVNNVVYLRWVQEAATAHWMSLATAEQIERVAWVALRHEIDYKHATRLGDQIVAVTWVGVAEAVRFERFVEIYRASDRKLLARARSLWAPINRASGRVTRASEELRQLFSR
jgi:acyl-CoA thioester hydrolase